MSRATLPAIAIASLVLHASPALGALTTITGVGITPQGASAISSGSLSPTPTSVSIIYSAVRANGAWCSLGEALQRSQGTSFDAMRGGFVVRATTDGTADIGTIHSGYLVPAPGAAVLTAFAGVLAQRRRR